MKPGEVEAIRERIKKLIAETERRIEARADDSFYLSGYYSGLTDAYMATFESDGETSHHSEDVQCAQ